MGAKCSSNVMAVNDSLDDFLAAKATSGYDLATGYCEVTSMPGVANTKLSACYASCATNADCAAVVFENDLSADNTNCWFKTSTASASTATGVYMCAASSGLSADGTQLIPTPSIDLSYLELKPNSVS